MFVGDGKQEQMTTVDNFDFSKLASLAAGLASGAIAQQAVQTAQNYSQQSQTQNKRPFLCCFGGSGADSDDDFDERNLPVDEPGKPPGHRRVIVVGAGGMVGRAVLPVLVFRYGEHLEVYAGTRNPASFAHIKGVNVVKADMANKKTLTKTLKHFDRAMVIVPNNRPDLAANALEAADSAGSINFVLVLSVLTAPLNETVFGYVPSLHYFDNDYLDCLKKKVISNRLTFSHFLIKKVNISLKLRRRRKKFSRHRIASCAAHCSLIQSCPRLILSEKTGLFRIREIQRCHLLLSLCATLLELLRTYWLSLTKMQRKRTILFANLFHSMTRRPR